MDRGKNVKMRTMIQEMIQESSKPAFTIHHFHSQLSMSHFHYSHSSCRCNFSTTL